MDWYVYIGSGLPKKTLLSHLALFCSDTFISYGGNHITLPPLGPLSQNGKSVYVNPGSVDVFHAKFSSENIYFFAIYPSANVDSTIFVDPSKEPCPLDIGAIFKFHGAVITLESNFLILPVRFIVSDIFIYGSSFVHTLQYSIPDSSPNLSTYFTADPLDIITLPSLNILLV